MFESVGLTGFQKLHTTKNTKANCYKYGKGGGYRKMEGEKEEEEGWWRWEEERVEEQ